MIRRTLPITPAIIGTKLLEVLRLISGEALGVISCGEGLGGVIPCGEGLGGVLNCGERLGAIITVGDGGTGERLGAIITDGNGGGERLGTGITVVTGGRSAGPEETTVMLLVVDLYTVVFPVMDM